jgi:hypothetical protein
MTDAPQLSDDPRDKLRAVLNHNLPDPDDDLGTDYRDACGAWFATLTPADTSLAERVLEVYGDGNEVKAEWLSGGLPPAPKCPL